MAKLKNDPGYRAGWCIHYRGITGPRGEEVTSCEVGVEYTTVRGPHQPCFLDERGQSKPDATECALLRRPTADEIAAHKVWHDEHMGKMAAVMGGIREWRRAHRGQNFAEVIECPACKGRLHLSIAAYNGHVHGSCETDDCVRWME